MSKKKHNSSQGVWRTIGGRRVFIKTGQSLSDAMKDSGKFKTKMNEEAVKGAREEDLKEQYKDSLNNVSKMEYNGEITKEEYDKAVKNINKSYIDKRNEYAGIKKEDKFYTRKDGTKEYDPYKGTRFEKKYDSVVDRYDKDKDFRDMIKGEHEKTLKATRGEINSYFDLEDRDKKIGNKDDLYKMINDNYYNISREDFDKLYSEEASTRYSKADKEWHELVNKMGEDYEKYGTNNYKDVSRLNKLSNERDYYSLYRNDVDKIREQISQPVEYDYKSVSGKDASDFHFAGEELYSDDPNRFGDKIRKHNEKMFKEQKESARRVEERYKGTYEYLQETTNMNGSEILELLKRIDEYKK